MMLRGKYKIIWILFAAILLDMVVATFRMISISLWLWIVPVLYFILTVWTLVYVKTIKPLYLFLTILVGLNLTNLYIRIVNFESTLFTIWCPIMGSVGVLAGYLYVKYRLKAWLALGMSAFMWIYTASVGQDQWVEYLYFGRYPVKEGIGDDAIYSTVKDSIFIRDWNIDMWYWNFGILLVVYVLRNFQCCNSCMITTVAGMMCWWLVYLCDLEITKNWKWGRK